MTPSASRSLGSLILFALLAGCDITGSDPVSEMEVDRTPESCTIPQAHIFSAAPAKDWIPALANPDWVGPQDPSLSYLRGSDRVIGIVIDDVAYAIPLNILWWHEIVNLDIGGRSLAITHCPLTGSSLVFDREPLGGVQFGVSGLLFRNNLLMYDRSTGESLWPQMLRGARCGVQSGTPLQSVAAMEMRFDRWWFLHYDTRVIDPNTGFERDYTSYPYGDYAEPQNDETLFPRTQFDSRLPPKSLVLGLMVGDESWAIAFDALAQVGPSAAIHPVESAPELVVLWDTLGESAMAFSTRLEDGTRLTLRVEGTRIVDDETGSVWRFDGLALSGPLEGVRLEPIPEAHTAFWFAWTDFHPDTRLWDGS